MHPDTNLPLGTLANAALRAARRECKEPFELVWQRGFMQRRDAYLALAGHLGLDEHQCHFGLFEIEECRRAKAWAVSVLAGRA